ncbi:MAG: hypothetical protein K2X38_18140 [Gemmataceae bacterium]|nr:hypothetical protein [Gemmataceae bacterium]
MTVSHTQTGPLVSYGGFFNQQATIATRIKNTPFQDTVTPIGGMNMRAILAQAWNSNRPAHEATVRNYMTKTLGLHDVSVKLSPGNVIPGRNDVAFIMYVDPAKKTLALAYRIPGHTMRGTLAVPRNFDPSTSGAFDLDLTVFLAANGPGNAPMTYQGSRISVANFKHGILDLAITGAANSFGKAQLTDAGSGQLTRNNINSVLAPAVAATGLGVVTPGMQVGGNTFNLVFELSRPQLVVLRR